jgi:bacterioferritin (cytochrome b1)
MDSQEIIRVLQQLLEAEIAALEYYRIHAEAIEDAEIAEGVRAIIPAEHSHAVKLAARIRELKGAPDPVSEAAVRRGRKMGDESRQGGTLGMLRFELEQEQQAIKDYALPIAEIEDDLETLDILEEQLLDEMRHAKWLKRKILEFRGDPETG